MAIKVQLRNDTSAAWSAANPVLMQGEIGIDRDSGRIKIGDGATAWNALPFALTGPEGPQGQIGPNLALSGPGLTVPAGVPLEITMLNRDSYTTYAVAATGGTATLDGSTITFIGDTIGAQTLTISADDVDRVLTVNVVSNSLGSAPTAPPAIGEPLEGGFYAGNIIDTVTTATGSRALATGAVTLTIPPADLPKFYIGQAVRLAAEPDQGGSNVGLAEGVVIAGSGNELSIDLTTIRYGAGQTFSAWVIAAAWKLIVAPKAQGEAGSVQYRTATGADPVACRTLTNGPASTAAMEAMNAGTVVYPMARWVTDINNGGGIGGYADWYIPARDELELLWRNLKPVTNNNFVGDRPVSAFTYNRDANVSTLGQNGTNDNSEPLGAAYTATVPAQTENTLFRTGGAEAFAFGSSYYWTSSEFSSNNAWFQLYVTSSPGAQSSSYNKNNLTRARAVRRSIL